jgi:hypothetical protein
MTIIEGVMHFRNDAECFLKDFMSLIFNGLVFEGKIIKIQLKYQIGYTNPVNQSTKSILRRIRVLKLLDRQQFFIKTTSVMGRFLH